MSQTDPAVNTSGTRAYERQELTEAIKLLREWASWLVTIQTAGIAAVGALIGTAKDVGTWQMPFACMTVTLFALSIVAATFLIVALPAFYLRSRDLTAGTDLVLERAFETNMRFGRLRVLDLMNGEQYAFLAGIASFALFVASRILSE